MNKYQIFDLINQFGFHINDESSYLELFAVMTIIFSSIGLWCTIDIIVYFIVIHILNHKRLLEKASNYPLLLFIINSSKKIRWVFIWINGMILIYCLLAMIFFSIQILIIMK